ncbi:MAG TPA: hypothetical protein VFE32_10760 [Puia sp.]|jgi:hypothetical protein|nr:hypothetical protein [Puia sp.]
MRAALLLGLFITCAFAVPAQAQDGFISQSSSLSYNVFDRNGRTFFNPAPDVAGTPFFADDWRLGVLVTRDNYRYDSVQIRLNLQSGQIHVLDSSRTEIALARGYIKEVLLSARLKGTFIGTQFKNGFPPVDEQDVYSFYEVLSEGKCSLLHSMRKVILQRKDAVSGEVSKEYQLYEDYYVYDGKTMQRLKKDKAFILTALSDKRDNVGAFIDSGKLKLKSINEIKRVIDYYNKL